MMKKSNLLLVLFSLLIFLASCNQDQNKYVTISTEFGDMTVMLYNSTPKHRDNFLSLVEQGYYDSLLFHRVIPGFMIQGGDPDSKNAKPLQRLGMGGPGYRIDAEIGAPHFKGVLAAATDGNPQKASAGSQFYLVHGRAVDDAMLDQVEQQKGIEYSPEQRALYKEIGGYPPLDNDYTVFGEVVEGLQVIDQIVMVDKDYNNRPVKNIRMTIKMGK
ncbi:MAG: peptidylprolyl isomerase [Saprospiraceae bacterium]